MVVQHRQFPNCKRCWPSSDGPATGGIARSSTGLAMYLLVSTAAADKALFQTINVVSLLVSPLLRHRRFTFRFVDGTDTTAPEQALLLQCSSRQGKALVPAVAAGQDVPQTMGSFSLGGSASTGLSITLA